MKNILITSAGRRVELVQAFQEQALALNSDSKVFAIDLQPKLSAACKIADHYDQCPRVTDQTYLEYLLSYCLKNKIGLVIPTIDTELELLANEKEKFMHHGINLCVSSTKIIQTCRDKRKTGILFFKHRISYPEIYKIDNIKFPCFAKPYNGSCSIGARAIPNKDALTAEVLNDQDMIFMELIDKSYVEYTIDAYYDKTSHLKCIVPRKRIEVRAGEVSKGITKNNTIYADIIEKINFIDGAFGCLTIQVFVNEETNQYIGLEINPRFGGGYPLSYAAGANYPNWLIKEYLLEQKIPFFDSWQNNLLMLRYDAKILTHEPTL